jgi:hypothetical protein
MSWLTRIRDIDETKVELFVPDAVYLGTFAALGATLIAAVYIYFGIVLAVSSAVSIAVALLTWWRTTRRNFQRRRSLPYVVMTLLAVLLQSLECWMLDLPGRWSHLALGRGAPAFGTKMFVGFFFIGPVALGLWGALGVYLHRPWGNFIAWLLFYHAGAVALVIVLAQLLEGSHSLVPGLVTAPLLVLAAISGIRFLLQAEKAI